MAINIKNTNKEYEIKPSLVKTLSSNAETPVSQREPGSWRKGLQTDNSSNFASSSSKILITSESSITKQITDNGLKKEEQERKNELKETVNYKNIEIKGNV